MPDRKQFNTSITPTARERLGVLADKSGRSRDAFIEELLREYVDGAPTTQPEEWIRVPFRIDSEVLVRAQDEARARGEKLSEALRQRIDAAWADADLPQAHR